MPKAGAAAGAGFVVGAGALGALMATGAFQATDPCVGGTPAPSAYNISITDPPNQGDRIREYGNALLNDGTRGRFNPALDPDHDLAVMLQPPATQPQQRHFRYGPQGEIQAEQCTHKNTEAALREGRVVMRVNIRPGPGPNRPWPIPNDPGYHKRVGNRTIHYFDPGWSYVWIDSYRESTDSQGNMIYMARAIIVSASPNNSRVIQRPVVVQRHGAPHTSSYGLWYTTPNDDHAWSTCWEFGCCTVHGDDE